MALSDDMILLKAVPLFNGLDGEQLRLIAFGAEHRRLQRGDVLFNEGEPADCAYVVAAGSLDLYVVGANGAHHRSGVAGKGVMMSELALATEVERKFTAVATEDADIMRIGRGQFHRLIEEYPELAAVIRQHIAASLVGLARGASALRGRFT